MRRWQPHAVVIGIGGRHHQMRSSSSVHWLLRMKLLVMMMIRRRLLGIVVNLVVGIEREGRRGVARREGEHVLHPLVEGVPSLGVRIASSTTDKKRSFKYEQ